jgi:hypothetical protein
MTTKNSDNKKENKRTPGLLDGLPPTIQDPAEYQRMIDSLPEEHRKYADLATRFAKIWEYLSDNNMPLPTDVVEAMRDLPKLPPDERLELLEEINAALLEYENDANKSSSFRQ